MAGVDWLFQQVTQAQEAHEQTSRVGRDIFSRIIEETP
jgi:hypothetical protein